VEAELAALLLTSRGELRAVLRAPVLPERHGTGDDRSEDERVGPDDERVHEPSRAAETAHEPDAADRAREEEDGHEDEQHDARDVVEDVGHPLAQASAPVLVVHV
jgi:hypothetical protein